STTRRRELLWSCLSHGRGADDFRTRRPVQLVVPWHSGAKPCSALLQGHRYSAREYCGSAVGVSVVVLVVVTIVVGGLAVAGLGQSEAPIPDPQHLLAIEPGLYPQPLTQCENGLRFGGDP